MKNQSVIVIIGLIVFVAGAITYNTFGTKSIYHSMGMNMQIDNQADVPPGMHRMPDGSLMSNVMPTNQADQSIGMMGNMDHSMMMVKSEREFLTKMIPHHEEAVATAQEVLARGATTPEIKQLAENIVSSQTREVTLMKQWYEEWYGTPYAATKEYKSMMRDLSQLSGVMLDRTFLEDMIRHHMGAIMMAKSVEAVVEHDVLNDLVQEIVVAQSREITLMQAYLKILPQ